ncbi:MAG: hypothetical protein LBF68_08565, partial [Christensenellaceae bacterium]|nr:hypothetical protein [Christensenellaceae bacterium]
MTQEKPRIRDPFNYKLIYIYSIDDKRHKGLLKIGETTFDNPFVEDNHELLKSAAHVRIKQQTQTAGIPYTLLHTAIAISR